MGMTAAAADTEYQPVKVTRRIKAEPAAVFDVLSDPSRHPEIDGSGMLRSTSASAITGVGDEFSMAMYFEPLGGDYVMINRVVEFEPNRRIGWEPAPGDAKSARNGEIAMGARVGHRWSFELTDDTEGSTIVTEIFDCSEAPASLRQAIDDGRYWEGAMVETLTRIADMFSGPPPAA
jgi:uncharacterized protein YndB with AHSA1/START domain